MISDKQPGTIQERWIGLLHPYQATIAALAAGAAYTCAYCYDAGWRMSQGVPLTTSIQYGRYIFPIVFAGTLVSMLHLLLASFAYLDKKTEENERLQNILGILAVLFLLLVGWSLWYVWYQLANFLDSVIIGISVALGYASIRWIACRPKTSAALRVFLIWMTACLVLVCIFAIGVFFGLRQTQWTIIQHGDTEYVLFERREDQILVAPLMRDHDGYESRFRLLTVSDDMVFQREIFSKLRSLTRNNTSASDAEGN